jgi:hypothetical protein
MNTIPKWAKFVLICVICLSLIIGIGLLIDAFVNR